jgi:hypothetical protein
MGTMRLRLQLRVEADDGTEWGDNFNATVGSQTVHNVIGFMEDCLNLLYLKEQHYQGAWRQQGWMGQTARILSKASRIHALVWREQVLASGDETTDETIQDLANLCFLWMINKAGMNKWGENA